MSSRNLFRIILKVIGLFLIPGLLTSLGQFVIFLIDVFTASESDYGGFPVGLFATATIVAAYVVLLWFLLFKTDMIIDKLQLERGIDTQLWPAFTHNNGEFRLKPIISLALLLLSIYIIVEEIPNLITLAYNRYDVRHYEELSNNITRSIVLSVANIVVAALLISNCNVITAFIESKIKKDEDVVAGNSER